MFYGEYMIFEGFFNFLQLLYLTQYIFFILKFLESIHKRSFQFRVVENISVLFYHSFHIR